MPRTTIALLLDYAAGEYQQELGQAVESAALERGLNLLMVIGGALGSPRSNELALNRVYDWISSNSVEGVILPGVISTQCDTAQLLALRDRLRPLPLCTIGAMIP